MALNRRQKQGYGHRCDIVRVGVGPIVNGKPTGVTYTLNARNVPCLYSYTDNVSDPIEGVGRAKRTMIFTLDSIHFEQSVEIDDGWITINRTLRKDGSRHQLWGEVHKVGGDPKVFEDSNGRHANKKSVYAATLEHVPPEVQAMV